MSDHRQGSGRKGHDAHPATSLDPHEPQPLSPYASPYGPYPTSRCSPGIPSLLPYRRNK